MKLRWHKLVIECPKCHTEPLLTAISYSADGEVLVEALCTQCGIQLASVLDSSKLFTSALYADIQDHITPQAPKLLLPAPDNKKQEDNNFLHDLGIEGM